MTTPAIRAALERLVELDGHLNETSPGWMQAWSDAIAAARAALAEPVATDEDLWSLWANRPFPFVYLGDQAMSIDLKPCPFCGGAAIVEDQRLMWAARCTSCGAYVLGDRAPEPEQEMPEGYWEPFRQSAVDRWNRRAALAEPVGEVPTDEELLELMPQQFKDDLATVSRLVAHGTSPDVTPGIFRLTLNTGDLDYARAVLARWGHPAHAIPLPQAGEVGA